ncbi:Phosphatidate cytidylyltransferase [Pediococcus pentosaceus]|uniref:Phosphatidate cytidylyltransferase n=1 Tax=Pediococcus pentosaceus (strain ATCC 25745 / CCUG 21536 / LMG 10740 / 183-1w) TaxID=278197 RepID=Q03FT1_PEDPA|nr:CDP-diglyceride synthetase [Pediococcus pentosaceus ATCC 25745]ASC08564.1 Phosphatidate cytidylyltransferase [Pediococcus pentosaceus]QHM59409.1 Phosphatidate cytidylyltransferase [Pediococcus pentosaceus]QHM64522.1 Phosphatidate cytidylyltransferase [Pediococcus pentosaceus]QHM66240.1 Phosphatidate cytidylyltransferase [Pediococcus pentosaceus]
MIDVLVQLKSEELILKQRVITAVVALIIFIPIVFLGGTLIEIAALALAVVAMSEVLIMKRILLVTPEAIISILGTLFLVAPKSWMHDLPSQINTPFVSLIFAIALMVRVVFSKNRFNFDDAGVLTLTMLYIGFGFNMFVQARTVGLGMLMYLLLTVWSTDSGAYLVGRKIGKTKLAPQISPNKTWEGSIGGTIVAVIVGIIFSVTGLIHYGILATILMTLFLSIAGQLGDLVESSLKRYYGVKDSGRILPGHGGILDRFDSLLLVLPMAYLLGLL